MSEKVTLNLIDVLIDRGRDVLTVAVPEHEIRILRAVHGVDAVTEADEQEGDEDDFDTNANAEIARLVRKYRRVNSEDPVRIAYPGGADEISKFGFSGTGKAEKASQSQAKKGVKAKKAAAKTAAK